jgi:hypothetical protein
MVLNIEPPKWQNTNAAGIPQGCGCRLGTERRWTLHSQSIPSMLLYASRAGWLLFPEVFLNTSSHFSLARVAFRDDNPGRPTFRRQSNGEDLVLNGAFVSI